MSTPLDGLQVATSLSVRLEVTYTPADRLQIVFSLSSRQDTLCTLADGLKLIRIRYVQPLEDYGPF